MQYRAVMGVSCKSAYGIWIGLSVLQCTVATNSVTDRQTDKPCLDKPTRKIFGPEIAYFKSYCANSQHTATGAW